MYDVVMYILFFNCECYFCLYIRYWWNLDIYIVIDKFCCNVNIIKYDFFLVDGM